jgi:hypothetical protein
MKICFLTLFALSLFGTSPLIANLSTVTYSAQSKDGALGSTTGVDLAVGSLVRFGYFNPAVDVAASFANISLLNSNFTELGHTFVGYFQDEGVDVNLNELGIFASSVNIETTTIGAYGATLGSTRMYIWAYDSSAVGTSSAHAIFSDQNWIVGGASTPVFDVVSARPSQLGDVYLAQLGPGISSRVGGGTLNQLLPVPEPSALLLSALTLGSLSLTRRRRL